MSDPEDLVSIATGEPLPAKWWPTTMQELTLAAGRVIVFLPSTVIIPAHEPGKPKDVYNVVFYHDGDEMYSRI